MSLNPFSEDKSAGASVTEVTDSAGSIGPSQFLEALPGPAWIVDCSSFQVVQCNAAASVLSGKVEFSALFPARLDHDLLERLRSAEQQIGFQARVIGESSLWIFSAALLPGVFPSQRLILAQPSAAVDVPAQLTFDELLDSAFDGLVILNAQRCIVQISVRFQQMFGYSIEELRGKPPEFLIPPGHEHEFKLSNELLDRGGIHHVDALRLRRDGTLLEVQVSSQAIASGRFRGGLVVIYRDLTEANRNARHRDFRLKATSILAAATTVENAARELLPLMAEVLKWDVVRLWQVGEDGLQCVGGHSISGFYCSGDSEGVGAKCTIRAEEVARDGRSIWVSDFYPLASCNARAQCRLQDGWLAAFPLVDSQQQVLGVLELLAPQHPPESGQRELLESICTQLGQFFTRCKAEQSLAESEAKFRTLAETAPLAIFIHVDGVVLYVNAAFERIFGYSREEMLNRSVWPLFHPEDAEAMQDRARRRIHGENVEKHFEARMIRKDGEARFIDYSAERIMLGNRPVVLVAASDLTERRALENQFQQTQKMEAIGLLAGGIAHDFNNLLMVIGCCSEAISVEEGLPAEVRQGAEEITRAADRATALTRQLLAFSRHQVLAPRMVDLNSVITETELILRRALGDDIVLRLDLEAGLGAILADASQIEQVVMNLAVNASDAMPNGGELSISTSSISLDKVTPQTSASHSGAYAVLVVTDNGIGIDPNIQQHIFEPFYTTKHASKGTGLGLSTVYGIAKQSGGFVTVDSLPRCGATFKVFLPIAGEIPATAAAPENRAPATAFATILLVEDEDGVRAVLHSSLVRDGYTVMQASGGAQALEVCAAYEGKIDLLLTDVVMPGMSGRELADRLVVIRPGMKVLFVSGYNEDRVLQKGVVEGEMEFLQKPFTPAVLSRKVRQILSR